MAIFLVDISFCVHAFWCFLYVALNFLANMLRNCKGYVTIIEMSHERISSTTKTCASMCALLSMDLCFDYFLLINLRYMLCLFCPESQEEKMSPKTPVVSPKTVSEGNDGNEAGRKMWGQGEISRSKVVIQFLVEVIGEHTFSGQGWRKKTNEDYKAIQIYTSWCQLTMSLHIFIAWAQAV